jgi:hypothetical protein
VNIELVGERREDVEDPIQLHRRAGVQLENIGPGHQHIDLIYFARPRDSTKIHAVYSEDKVGWYGPEAWVAMIVNAEVRGWCERALSALEGYGSVHSFFGGPARHRLCQQCPMVRQEPPRRYENEPSPGLFSHQTRYLLRRCRQR